MPARTMRVSMRKFLFRCGTHFGDLDVEDQRLAGHRMVEVDGRHGVADLQHRNLLVPRLGVDHRHHAGLPLAAALQVTDRNATFGVQLPLTEGLGRCEGHAEALSLGLSLQRLLEARQEPALSMQIGHRMIAGGGLKLLAIGIPQDVMETDYLTGTDLHGLTLWKKTGRL